MFKTIKKRWKKIPITLRATYIAGLFSLLAVILAWALNSVSKNSVSPRSSTNEADSAMRITQDYFELEADSISDFNVVWCDLLTDGDNKEFYASYYQNRFTKHFVVFSTRGSKPENLLHYNSKGGVELLGGHVSFHDKPFFILATIAGNGCMLDLHVFKYDGINKLELVHKEEETLPYGNLWLVNNHVYVSGGNHRYELIKSVDGFKLVDYEKRVQHLPASTFHVLAYHIDENDLRITYDNKPIQFALCGKEYVNEEPIVLASHEQIIVDDNLVGHEIQIIRLLTNHSDFDFKPGFFYSLAPTGEGIKELGINYNYGRWYKIKVLVKDF